MRKKSRDNHAHIIPHVGEPAELAARLSPPEELRQSTNHSGAILVDTSRVSVPNDFTEKRDEKDRFLNLDPIAMILLAFALVFIAVMAYLIYIEPPKPDEQKAASESPPRT